MVPRVLSALAALVLAASGEDLSGSSPAYQAVALRNAQAAHIPAPAGAAARFAQTALTPIIDSPRADMATAALTDDTAVGEVPETLNAGGLERAEDNPALALRTAPRAAVQLALLETGDLAGANALASAGGGDATETEASGKGKGGADLSVALEEIKADIVDKSKQVLEEKAWIDQVTQIIQSYQLKMDRVNVNIASLRKEIKDLYTKKRQIENLILQGKLEAKLNDAKADLSTLDSALQHVKQKESSFEQNRNDVSKTVLAINAQLAKLRGETATPAPAEAGKGAASGEGAEGEAKPAARRR